MNAQEIFVEAARVLYNYFHLYKKEKKNKEESDNAKLTNKVSNEKKKKGCC